MSKAWSVTQEEVDRANQFAEIMSSEVNVQAINIPLGIDDKDREVVILYKHNTLSDRPERRLDVYANGEPLNKPDFAAWIFIKTVLLEEEI